MANHSSVCIQVHSISFKNLPSLAGHVFNPFPLKHYCCMMQYPFKNSLDERLNYPEMFIFKAQST